MDLLKKALDEALARNAAETERWTAYRDDQRQAADNMESFRKKLEVEVMVPVGGKALMPGKLYHTNEIFVSHSSRMYSKCTAHQAIGVCEHRIGTAAERLKALQVEREMYQNKLDLPAAEEAFQRADGEQEIIEEYDEAKEVEWRKQHRHRVREHKMRERAEREQADREDAVNDNCGAADEDTPIMSDIDVLHMLDELEQLEDLEAEMKSLQADGVSDEQLQQLLSGELTPSSDATVTKRVAHQPSKVAQAEEKPVSKMIANVNDAPAANMPSLTDHEVPDSSDSCNDDGQSLNESDDDEDVPDQLRSILLQAHGIGTTQERIRFLREKIREVQLELRAEKAVSSVVELVSRSDRMFVCERLQQEINRLLEDNDKFFFSPGFQILHDDLKKDICRKRQTNIEENEAFKADFPLVKDYVDLAQASPPAAVELKRSVSFGADEVASFSKHQAPRRVSDDRRNAAQLDSDDLSSSESDSDSSASDTTTRLAKLVGTMKLSGKVSEGASAKPILKNKQAVQKERHRSKTVSMSIDEPKMTAGRKAPNTDSEPMVEFNKIIGDIFEKIYPQAGAAPTVPISKTQPATGVEPLPSVSFRDAHAPKPRVSRFKASRQK